MKPQRGFQAKHQLIYEKQKNSVHFWCYVHVYMRRKTNNFHVGYSLLKNVRSLCMWGKTIFHKKFQLGLEWFSWFMVFMDWPEYSDLMVTTASISYLHFKWEALKPCWVYHHWKRKFLVAWLISKEHSPTWMHMCK